MKTIFRIILTLAVIILITLIIYGVALSRDFGSIDGARLILNEVKPCV